jgi:hypothetical protein
MKQPNKHVQFMFLYDNSIYVNRGLLTTTKLGSYYIMLAVGVKIQAYKIFIMKICLFNYNKVHFLLKTSTIFT